MTEFGYSRPPACKRCQHLSSRQLWRVAARRDLDFGFLGAGFLGGCAFILTILLLTGEL